MKRIYLTVDTECHDINRINQYIYGNKKSKSFGLVDILETGKELNIPINFMLDVCEQKRYGEKYLVDIINLIHSYNQPIYFHLHPNYITNDDDRSFLWQYSKEEMKNIFKESLEIYEKYCGKHDMIIFRAGRYGTDETFYEVLKETGLKVLDLSYFYGNNKMCKLEFDKIQSINVPKKLDNIILLPNTSYIGYDFFGEKRTFILNVANTTNNEFKKIVRNNEMQNMVYTMHSWDFIKKWFFMPNYIGENKKNIKKLKKAVHYAEKNHYVFSDLKDFTFSEDCDEIRNLCKGFTGKLSGLINNFVRFSDIAHLNKKYFMLYSFFYFFLVALIVLIILLIVL